MQLVLMQLGDPDSLTPKPISCNWLLCVYPVCDSVLCIIIIDYHLHAAREDADPARCIQTQCNASKQSCPKPCTVQLIWEHLVDCVVALFELAPSSATAYCFMQLMHMSLCQQERLTPNCTTAHVASHTACLKAGLHDLMVWLIASANACIHAASINQDSVTCG